MRNVIKIIVHENYDHDNDIALLKLEKPLQYSNVIKPVKLPKAEEDFSGQLVTVSGWGQTENGSGSEELLFTDLRILNRTKCEEMFVEFGPKAKFTKGMSCATTHDGEPRSPCHGDSGGPIVLKDTSILVGIVSHGPSEDKCGDVTAYNTRVSHYIDWIEAHIKGSF